MGINALVHMKHSLFCSRVSVIFISFIIVKVDHPYKSFSFYSIAIVAKRVDSI